MTVLPDGMGPAGHPNVLIGSDKQAHLWMIDRTRMSQYSPNFDNTVQFLSLPGFTTCTSIDEQCVYASPAYWNGTVYISIEYGSLMALPLLNGLIPNSQQLAVPASQSAETYGFPSPTPSISASSPSGAGAIVWVLDNSAYPNQYSHAVEGPAILRAYDATNLGNTLYSSATLPADTAGNAVKFALPVVANGHVYVAGDYTLTVYGLAP